MIDSTTIQILANFPLAVFLFLYIRGDVISRSMHNERIADKDKQIEREREVQKELLRVAREGTQTGVQGAIVAQQAIEALK